MKSFVCFPRLEASLPGSIVQEPALFRCAPSVKRALKRRVKTIASAEQAIVERALGLASGSYDSEQMPLPEDVHCPDAVVGVLSALEEFGQPGTTLPWPNT